MLIKTEKASKIVASCLHYSVIVSLIVVICTGFIGAIATQKLVLAYDGNCMLNVKLIYEAVENETTPDAAALIQPKTQAPPIQEVTSTTVSYIASTGIPALEPVRNASQANHPHIYRALGKKKNPDPLVAERHLQVDGIHLESEADVYHLSSTKINVRKTHWGNYAQCEYFIFYPLFTAMVGILWGTMVIMFRGKGPKEFDWGVPRPWRIVLPSIVIFTLMTAFSLAYIIYIEPLKTDFCNMLKANLTTEKLKCGDLVQSYELKNPDGFSTRINYDLSTLMPRINISAWAIALLIMLARFFFAVDFQLVKVTVSTYKENGDQVTVGSSSKEELEQQIIRLHNETPAKQLEFDKKSSGFSSKDDLEDFESAASDTEMTTFTTSAPSSLEPLLHQKNVASREISTNGI